MPATFPDIAIRDRKHLEELQMHVFVLGGCDAAVCSWPQPVAKGAAVREPRATDDGLPAWSWQPVAFTWELCDPEREESLRGEGVRSRLMTILFHY